MKIKSKFMIIMITCFALISCMAITSAADVQNANHTGTHNQISNVHSTNNGPVMAQNAEIKTINSKNNNNQINNLNDNQNNKNFQNQQPNSNTIEKNTIPENQKQPEYSTRTNNTQQRTMPQQDQNNIPTNMTPKFNDNNLPEIQQPTNNQIPENQNQPMPSNPDNNNNTMPQGQQNFKDNVPGSMMNMTPNFNGVMPAFLGNNTVMNQPMPINPDNNNNTMPQGQQNFNDNVPGSMMNMTPNFNGVMPAFLGNNTVMNQPMPINPDNNNNTMPQGQQNFNDNVLGSMMNMTPNFNGVMPAFLGNNTVMNQPKPDMNQTKNNNDNKAFDPNKNQKLQQPQKNLNKDIPQTINNINPAFNNNQKPSILKNKINQKQINNKKNSRFPMRKNRQNNMNNPITTMNNSKPENMGTPMGPMNGTMPNDMNNPMTTMNNSKPENMGNYIPSNNNIDNSQTNNVTYSTGADGQLFVSGTTTTKNNTLYTVTNSETNTVLVQNGATLTLSNSKIIKTGDTTNSGNSEFLGTNAAILTTYGSTAYIINSTIVTDASGANAIFATNTDNSHSGATIYVNDTTIDTYQDKSRGLDATYGGIIIADNVTINTRGGSCAALATDRGEGTVKVSNSILNTGVDNGTGQGSPCIYSTGNITVINSTGTAYGAQIACIEGKNSITLINSTLYCSGEGNRQENGTYVDLAGVFIYQSMSGDADVGTAVFTSTNSNLTILSSSDYYTTAPMFYVTNTKGIVTISNTTLNFGSGVLIKVSNQNQWGTTGSNGGDLTFNAINESLKGNIIVGDYSSLSLDLKNSTYTGAITTSNSATSSITIESGSTWTLTGDSYVTSLTNYGNIICGNYTLYVNGVKYTI